MQIDTKFHVDGWSASIQEHFSCMNIFLNRRESIQGYYVSTKATNVFCVKGMICLVTYNLDDFEIIEKFIGDENRVLITVQPNIAFAWKNISECESIVITDLRDVKTVIDVFNEDKQNSILGVPIPYQF